MLLEVILYEWVCWISRFGFDIWICCVVGSMSYLMKLWTLVTLNIPRQRFLASLLRLMLIEWKLLRDLLWLWLMQCPGEVKGLVTRKTRWLLEKWIIVCFWIVIWWSRLGHWVVLFYFCIQVFLDVVESVNILVNSNGQLIRSDVVGALKMRTFLRFASCFAWDLLYF